MLGADTLMAIVNQRQHAEALAGNHLASDTFATLRPVTAHSVGRGNKIVKIVLVTRFAEVRHPTLYHGILDGR